MSLITTCPSCGTSFRVTPEQLGAYRGDVRCGKCQHIFSALKQLEEVVPVAPLTPVEEAAEEYLPTVPPATSGEPLSEPVSFDLPPEPPHEPPIEPPPETEPALNIEPLDFAPLQAEHEPRQEDSPAPVADEIEPSTAPPVPLSGEPAEQIIPDIEAQPLSIDTQALDFEIEPAPVAEQESVPSTEPTPDTEEIELKAPEAWPEEASTTETAAGVEPAVMESQQEPTPQSASAMAAEPAVPSFLASPPRRRPVMTGLLALSSVALLLLLVAQSTYFMRNALAARQPQWMPWLEDLCRPLQCKIELPHQAELLSIEDSDLQDDTDHDAVLVLRSLLDNRAAFTQALPLLELTLTDTGDVPVLRRTFTPREYLPKEMSPEKGIAAGAQIQIRLNLVTEGIKPAGYRLYVRY